MLDHRNLGNLLPCSLSHEAHSLHGMQGVRSSSLLGSIFQIDCGARGYELFVVPFLLSHFILIWD